MSADAQAYFGTRPGWLPGPTCPTYRRAHRCHANHETHHGHGMPSFISRTATNSAGGVAALGLMRLHITRAPRRPSVRPDAVRAPAPRQTALVGPARATRSALGGVACHDASHLRV
jgi:hypothetical protein